MNVMHRTYFFDLNDYKVCMSTLKLWIMNIEPSSGCCCKGISFNFLHAGLRGECSSLVPSFGSRGPRFIINFLPKCTHHLLYMNKLIYLVFKANSHCYCSMYGKYISRYVHLFTSRSLYITWNTGETSDIYCLLQLMSSKLKLNLLETGLC